MSTSALILMILVQGTVIVVSAYFLIKVLRIPPKAEENQTEENTDLPD